MAVTPLLKFAITRQLTVGGGVRIAELDPLLAARGLGCVRRRWRTPAIGSLQLRAAVGPKVRPRTTLDAAFTVHAGTRSLESDLVYERYLGQGDYSFRLAQPRGAGVRHGRRHQRRRRRCSSASRSAIRGRCAAGTSTTSLRPAATGCSTRRSNTRSADSGCSSTPARSGITAPSRACARLDGRHLQPRPVVPDGGLSAQHQRVPRRVHDGGAFHPGGPER